MPPDPRNYDFAVSGIDPVVLRASMADERTPLIEQDVFGWADPLQDLQAIPSRFIERWKYDQDGMPCRHKLRMVVQGFHEADTGADKAAPVASHQSVHLLTAMAAKRRYYV